MELVQIRMRAGRVKDNFAVPSRASGTEDVATAPVAEVLEAASHGQKHQPQNPAYGSFYPPK